MTVPIHSYSSDIAEVLCIKLVNGSANFFPNRGSSGHKAPNYREEGGRREGGGRERGRERGEGREGEGEREGEGGRKKIKRDIEERVRREKG